MKVLNPFHMHNWGIEKFVLAILLIHVAVFSITGLELLGIHLPLVGQLIAFIYLTFVPGILIIRIFRMHRLGAIEVLLYSVGLSIASLMFIGLFINSFYPIIGIKNPISLMHVLFTFGAFVLSLLIICYKLDNGYNKVEYINIKEIISPWPLFFFLIPFLVIIGTYLVNYYNNITLIMFIILLISVIPILVAFNRIPQKYYPLGIFVIAISLLYHTALISKFVWGYDVIVEYHFADIVLKNSFWDPSLFNSYNGVLSIVMLLPIYSIITNLNLDAIIKVIYPFIYSLVPLGLYILFKNQTKNNKIAFLSVFLFMSLLTFFVEMVSLARQEVAELFLVIFLILFFSKETYSKEVKVALYAILGSALIVSHYSIAFLYAFIFLGVWLLLNIFRSTRLENLIDKIFISSNNTNSKSKKNFLNVSFVSNPIIAIHKGSKGANTSLRNYIKVKVGYLLKNILFSHQKNTNISIVFFILFIAFSLVWYYLVSNSYTYMNFIYLIGGIIGSITDLLNPSSSQGLQAVLAEFNSPARVIEKYLYLITQFLIIIGFLSVVLKKYRKNFEDSYIAFSFCNLLVLFALLVLPNLAGSFNTSRFYALSLIFLAPYIIIGGITILRYFTDKVESWKSNGFEHSLKPLAVFLTIFILFNTGFAMEFSGDYSSSMVFNKNDWVFFFQHDQDVASAQWLEKYRTGRVYGDYFSALSFQTFGYIPYNNLNGVINDSTHDTEILYKWTAPEPGNYIYQRYGDILTIKTRYNNPYYEIFSVNLTKNMNKIYDSNSEIYGPS